eukprot:7212948-Prymnesium_polylepis.1
MSRGAIEFRTHEVRRINEAAADAPPSPEASADRARARAPARQRGGRAPRGRAPLDACGRPRLLREAAPRRGSQ